MAEKHCFHVSQALLGLQAGNACRLCRHGRLAFQAGIIGMSGRNCRNVRQILSSDTADMDITNYKHGIKHCGPALKAWTVGIAGIADRTAGRHYRLGRQVCKQALLTWQAGITGTAGRNSRHEFQVW
jgi:hypothetical protein